MKRDYLKYWRVVRNFIKAKHGLNEAEVETLLFLYSEQYFDKNKFDEFNSLLSWDIKRFNRLLRDGWIETFRRNHGNRRSVYQLSFKGKRLVDFIYKKLEGEEIPMTEGNNPMFGKNVRYTDKVYRNMIIEMNKYVREKRNGENVQ
jgi:hypothetical protein